ncbi:hypothetical protein BC936DRAFT_143315, partial [Jimgerdemannia flammicorona]
FFPWNDRFGQHRVACTCPTQASQNKPEALLTFSLTRSSCHQPSTQLASSLDAKLKGGAPLFEVWMRQESDGIQALARAHGERIVLEQVGAAVQGAKGNLQKILVAIMTLWSLTTIDTNLAWYLTQGLISLPTGKQVPRLVREGVASLSGIGMDVVNALGVDERVLFAPIAARWDEYNKGDLQGELFAPELVAKL